MSKFDKAVRFYEDFEISAAHHVLLECFDENKNNQLLYPYLAQTSLAEGMENKSEFYLTYPFNNYLITDLRVLENNFDKSFWYSIYESLEGYNINIGRLTELILNYFSSEDEDKIDLLDDFEPVNVLQKYWHNVFYLNTYALASLSKTIFENKPYKQFNEKFEECIKLNPKGAYPYYLKFYMDPMPFVENLNKAIELKPDYFEALKERAWLCFDDGEYEECIEDCDLIVYHSPPNKYFKDALWQKGWALIMMEDYKGAIISFNQSLQIDSNQSSIYLYRGSAKNRINDYEGALIDYNKYLSFDENKSEPLILIIVGTLYLKLEQFHNAIKFYSEAIQVDNCYSIAYFRRASAFKAINQEMLAESDIKKANEIILGKLDKPFDRLDVSVIEL